MIQAPFTVRPAGGAAWRENIKTLKAAYKWRDSAANAGLRNLLIVDARNTIVWGFGAGHGNYSPKAGAR